MKTLTVEEIDQIIAEQKEKVVGAELQQILFDEKALQLKFYLSGQNTWFSFSLKPGVPFFFFTQERVFLLKNLKKPLALFLKTHFQGEKLISIQRDKALGRVVCLEFTGEGPKNLTLSLVTGRVNVEAQVGEKKVWALKPKEIEEMKPVDSLERKNAARDNSFFEKFWSQARVPQKASEQKDNQKAIKKKQAGLSKMRDKLTSMEKNPWQAFGEWLKSNGQSDSVPEEYEKFVNRSQSLSWNIENAFHQSKKNQAKLEGTRERVSQLEKEITELQEGKVKKKKVSPPVSLLSQADVKGKTIELSTGRLFVGKSGPDNLRLLRKAKAWYLWLHIKDYPGAYGILEKPKGLKDVDAETLGKAAQAVIRQSLPAGQEGKFDVIYTECRYVRPIKGAKSGQVTYSHETVLTVRV